MALTRPEARYLYVIKKTAMLRSLPLLTLLLLTLLTPIAAQVELTFTEVVAGLSQPVALEAPHDGSNRLFVVQKQGLIRIIDLNTETLIDGNFLDMSQRVSTNSERGLLGLAFHPDFAQNGEFYVHYTAASGTGIQTGSNVISRFTLADPASNLADPATEEILLTSPQDFSNHNGGDITFGPDGLLYFTIGDGGSGGDPNDRGQDPNSLMGTICRIDVNTSTVGGLPYGIPADNPYADGVGGQPEIYSIGWRNPWRISFDRLTGDLWVGDVGQNAREEISYAAAGTGAGLNYGWDCREGDIAYPGDSSDDCDPNVTYEDPIVAFNHGSQTMAARSITGGFVYRGTDWPELYGTYICGDYVTNNYFSILPDDQGGWDVFTQDGPSADGVSTFGEDESGELYLASIFTGTVLRVGGGISNAREFFRSADFAVEVFPNPVRDRLQLRFDNPAGDALVKVRLIDANGRAMKQQTLSLTAGTSTQVLRLPELPVGTYRLLVSKADGGLVKTVVIAR